MTPEDSPGENEPLLEEPLVVQALMVEPLIEEALVFSPLVEEERRLSLQTPSVTVGEQPIPSGSIEDHSMQSESISVAQQSVQNGSTIIVGEQFVPSPPPLLRILPNVCEFLHILDLLDLSQTSRQVLDAVNLYAVKNHRWRSLEIGDPQSVHSSQPMEQHFWDLFLYGPIDQVMAPYRRDQCEKLVLNGVGSEVLNSFAFFKTLMQQVVTLRMNKFDFSFSGFSSYRLTTLKLGVDLGLKGSMLNFKNSLSLPNLKTLEIVGFPVLLSDTHANTAPNVWLLSLLSSTGASLRWLRLNCELLEEENPESPMERPSPNIPWDSGKLFFLEIVFGRHCQSVAQMQCAGRFTEWLFCDSTAIGFPEMHTLILSAPTGKSSKILSRLSHCGNMLHLVLGHLCMQSGDDLTWFQSLFEKNAKTLQILVLKVHGKSPFHFDSFFQLILSHRLPLERFELEVVMDYHSGQMESPYHSLKACVALRCLYASHMYFKRSTFSISMSSQRFLCTEVSGPTSVPAPVDLFCEEMLKGMFETEEEVSSCMFAEWNAAGAPARSRYVEIFDEYVERELRSNNCEKYTDWVAMLNDDSGGSKENFEKSINQQQSHVVLRE